ncbi:MAG: mechanosensitive ion channel family protein [Alphaproteobacteria bacterium]|nr:MAG: mechanosensitive ion channel family protein [Alphaproteobacteria bacterium]
MIETATRQVDIFQQRLRRILDVVPDSFEEIELALQRQSPDGTAVYFLGVGIFVAILLIIGRAAGVLLAITVARRIMIAIQRPNPVGMVQKLPVLLVRVLITLVFVVVAVLVGGGIGASFFDQDPATQRTGIMIFATFAAILMIDTIWRMIISPYLPSYRIPKISDAAAIRLYRFISIATTIGVAAVAFTIWLELMEVKPEVVAFAEIVLGSLTTILLLVVVLSNRAAITGAILGGVPRAQASWLSALSAYLWAPVAIAYLLFSWGVASFNSIMGLPSPSGLAQAFVVFLVSTSLYAAIVYVVERVFARSRRAREINAASAAAETREAEAAEPAAAGEPAAAEDATGLRRAEAAEQAAAVSGGGEPVQPAPAPQPAGTDSDAVEPATVEPEAEPPQPQRHTMQTFEDLAHRVASLVSLGVAVWLVLRFWVGKEIFSENSIYEAALGILNTALFGYIIYHALRIWMDRKIAEEGSAEISLQPGEEGGAVSATSRIGTLLPLIRSFVLITVLASVMLIIAARLGVNVAPLFAGAGVVGLAIGFGAQTLVRDILSGMFFLLDDAFRRGEYIDVGEVKGTVEKISLRSFQLRHHLGALNTIPFGEIKHLTNYSRDWVIMKLPLRLTYDTDVERVRKLIKKLGQELLEHPTEGHKFVQPLKSQGVYMMEDSAMIIRVKFMTRPGDQWTTRKLVYQRIRELFEKEGIKFANREVTVRLPESVRPEALDEEDIAAIGAAARRAVDEADAQQGGQKVSLAEAR